MRIRSTFDPGAGGRLTKRVYELPRRPVGTPEKEVSVVEHVFRDPTVSQFTVTRTRNDGSHWSTITYERLEER